MFPAGQPLFSRLSLMRSGSPLGSSYAVATQSTHGIFCFLEHHFFSPHHVLELPLSPLALYTSYSFPIFLQCPDSPVRPILPQGSFPSWHTQLAPAMCQGREEDKQITTCKIPFISETYTQSKHSILKGIWHSKPQQTGKANAIYRGSKREKKLFELIHIDVYVYLYAYIRTSRTHTNPDISIHINSEIRIKS